MTIVKTITRWVLETLEQSIIPYMMFYAGVEIGQEKDAVSWLVDINWLAVFLALLVALGFLRALMALINWAFSDKFIGAPKTSQHPT